jgi:hypothetical protein
MKALQEEAVEARKQPILLGVAYVDVELADMDGQPDEGLSTTTSGKESTGQKGWDHSPIEGVWTYLVEV